MAIFSCFLLWRLEPWWFMASAGKRTSTGADEELELRAGLLQAQLALHEARVPAILIITGVDGAGKGEVVYQLAAWLHPRYLDTQAFWQLSDEELDRPYYWRFWRAMPSPGRLGIFLGSWYTEPMLSRVSGELNSEQFELAIARIERFERMLALEGMLIIKIALHLSKDAQRRRLEEMDREPQSHWRIFPPDWKHHKLYDNFVETAARMMQGTNRKHARWHVVDADDAEARDWRVGEIVLEAFNRKLADLAKARQEQPLVQRGNHLREILKKRSGPLSFVDLSQSLDKHAYKEKLAKYQSKLNRLAWEANRKRVSGVWVFEGWDAAGKGSCIRRVIQALDPRLYRVVPVAAPTEEERAHHYLWRFWRAIPRAGSFALFDRSWYGRVLVERVEGFAQDEQWRRAYAEINEFEQQLADHRIVVVKFWIHISKDEQLRRFKARAETPHKQYKITDDDWRNRRKWNLYEEAVNEMVQRTSTETAPWTLVAGNDKRFARVQILKTLCRSLEAVL